MKRSVLLWMIFWMIGPVWQAEAQNSGLLCSENKYRSIPVLPSYSGLKYNEVPLRVSLRQYCPVPGDQQRMGSCVGWAVGYGALTLMRAQRLGLNDPSKITQMANSAAFVYNQIRLQSEDCSAGAYIEDALALLKTKGDCLENTFNYKKGDCTTSPGATPASEALQYRIQDFAAVFNTQEEPKSKISKACKVLATQTPLVVGIAVTTDFWEIKPGTQLWDPAEDSPSSSHHALVLVGYDNVEKQFEFMNSFGASWGRNGFIRMKYDDFARLCKYAYVLLPEDRAESLAQLQPNLQETPSAKTEFSLSGTFAFRKPSGYLSTSDGQEIPYYEEVATRWNTAAGLYETQQASFEVGDVFQLVAREIPRGRYAYVFSQSPGSKVNFHFPKMNNQVATAGFVLEKTAEIVIPSEESVLQLPLPGEDFLCIIYSHSPIADISRRVEQLEKSSGEFAERVQKAFADIAIPATQVRYNADKMVFSARPDPATGKIAVPLILKVLAQ